MFRCIFHFLACMELRIASALLNEYVLMFISVPFGIVVRPENSVRWLLAGLPGKFRRLELTRVVVHRLIGHAQTHDVRQM